MISSETPAITHAIRVFGSGRVFIAQVLWCSGEEALWRSGFTVAVVWEKNSRTP
jgi:hypothetical protein